MPGTRQAAEARWRVRAALGTTVLMWGAAFVAIRHAAPSYPAGAFVLLRFLIPGALLGVAAARRGALLPPRGDRRAVLALGASFAAYIVLLVQGEKTVDAGTASMLAETSPLLTAGMAAVWLRERPSRWLLAGLLLGFAGAALIAVAEGGGVSLDAGALIVLGAATAQALLLVIQKPLLRRQTALQVVTQATLVGAVLMLPFAPALVRTLPDAPVSATLAVVFVAVTTGAVSYVLLAYAMARTPSAGATSAVLFLVPPLAILIGWALLGEAPLPLAVAGGTLALVGVAVAQRGGGR